MSLVEPVALQGQLDVEAVAPASHGEARPSSAEELFLDRLRAGEAAAFDRLVTERTADVYALLCRLTDDPEEARDLTQETFLQAFRAVAHFRGEADLRTWLYRIAVNQARNRWRWWRRRRRDTTVSLDAPAASNGDGSPLGTRLCDTTSLDPETNALANERERALLAALGKLARPYREAIVLRDIEGLSYEEVAAALNINVGTVKSRLSRGRLELRRRLEGIF